MLETLLTTILGNFILTIAFGLIFVFIKFKIIPYFKKPKIIQGGKKVKTGLQIAIENSKINDKIILCNKNNPKDYPNIVCQLIAYYDDHILLKIINKPEKIEHLEDSGITILENSILVHLESNKNNPRY